MNSSLVFNLDMSKEGVRFLAVLPYQVVGMMMMMIVHDLCQSEVLLEFIIGLHNLGDIRYTNDTVFGSRHRKKTDDHHEFGQSLGF